MSNLSLIKKLRETTGCGIADCNKALAETGGDFEQAVDWLRKKGLSSAAKKSGRVTSEGVVAVAIEGGKAAVIEVNSETDFVARNQKFQEFVTKISVEALAFGDDIGKIAVLVALESPAVKEVAQEKLQEFGKQIAMHIAAAKPDALSVENVDPAKLARESEIFKEQARASGKPENIIEKMIQGRIRKYHEEVVLLEQNFVMDDKVKIKDLLAQFSKENGETKISAFKLFVLGEGIEKKENDFAAEVASMTKN